MSRSDQPRICVLFVCLGNICRSPMAKWIFADLVAQRGLDQRIVIDSCGTGHWHVGSAADPRACATAAAHGHAVGHTARQIEPSHDFVHFDLLIAMAGANHEALFRLGAPRQRVRLMRSFDPSLEGSHDVPDPYYGGDSGFEQVYQMLVPACEGLLAHCQGLLAAHADY